MGRWISVKEKTPDTVGNYLVYAPLYKHSHNGIAIAHFSRGMWKVDSVVLNRCIVTHWQPLPTEPQGSDFYGT